MIKKIGFFWILIIGWIVFGYFCAANREWLTVIIPHITELRVRASEAYMWSFFSGVALTFAFFSLDSIRKSFLIRKLKKKQRDLESNFPPLSMPMSTSTPALSTDEPDFDNDESATSTEPSLDIAAGQNNRN